MQQEQSLSDFLVKDIDPAARQWFERVMGRSLSDDERLCVLAYQSGDGSQQASRFAARERLLQLMDQAAAHVDQLGVSDDVLENTIEEAIDHARVSRS